MYGNIFLENLKENLFIKIVINYFHKQNFV